MKALLYSLAIGASILAMPAFAADRQEHSSVTVVSSPSASSPIPAHAKESLEASLRAALADHGLQNKGVILEVEGYFVRPGSTPRALAQLGGRDIVRGHLKVTSADGTVHDLGKVKVSLASEGFHSLGHSRRQALLHQALGRSVTALASERI